VLRNGVLTPVTRGVIGACESPVVSSSVSYNAFGPSGVGAGFSGGTGFIKEPNGTLVNVTPADMATTLIGVSGDVGCPGAVGGKLFTQLHYTLTAADISAGSASFALIYTNGVTALRNAAGQCNLPASASIAADVSIAPLPTCTGAGAQTICQGGSATFTSTVTADARGPNPVTICWQKGCPGSGACLSSTASLTINNAQPSDSGCYTITVTDSFGCVTSCQANLTVNPTPSCTLAGPTQICPGSTHTYTSTVSPSGGTVTHAWSITGNGTITGSTTGSSVSVTAGAAAPGTCSSFTLSDSVTRNGCPAAAPCTLTVNFCQPSCVIAPASATLCSGASQQFCVTVTGNSGAVTISWTKNGSAFAGNVNCINAVAPASGTDTYVANVTDAVGCITSCSATLTGIPCIPNIAVTKEIICASCGTPGCDASAFNGSKTATGAKGANCPAFCYRITVRNTSQAGIELHNVSVVDDHLSLTSCGFPTTLAAPGSAGDSASCIVGPIEHCSDVRNIVTATGTGVQVATGTTLNTVTARDTNNAVVVPLVIECDKLASIDGAPATQNPACQDVGSVHSVVYSLLITNESEVAIDVAVSDPGLTVGGSSTVNVAIGVGQAAIVTFDAVSLTFTCPLGNTANLTATVGSTVTGICACDVFGRPITNNTSCSINLCCNTPTACRVTGGGKQDQVGQRNGKIPNVDPRANPLVAQYVTHGGQVGAPVGTATEWDPCSKCIKGEWEHVRHFRPGLDGNFHARHFDSLECACLACPGDPNSGSGSIVGRLCNPGDRYCGPEPRRAPANKICFSGIGDYTMTNGRRTPLSVAFRVDIEDHGEPGCRSQG